MDNRESAKAAVKKLAMDDVSPYAITRRLDREGLGGLLSGEEVESLISEAQSSRRGMEVDYSKILPRAVGAVAVLFGVISFFCVGGDSSKLRKVSPFGYGGLAVVLGVILIAKPDWSRTDG